MLRALGRGRAEEPTPHAAAALERQSSLLAAPFEGEWELGWTREPPQTAEPAERWGRACLCMGVVMAHLGRLGEADAWLAEAEASSAARSSRPHGPVILLRAIVAGLRADPSAARAHQERAGTADLSDPAAALLETRLALLLGDHDLAARGLAALAEQREPATRARVCALRLAIAVHRGRFQEALAEASHGLEGAPPISAGWTCLLLARAALGAEDLATAERWVVLARARLTAGRAFAGVSAALRTEARIKRSRGVGAMHALRLLNEALDYDLVLDHPAGRARTLLEKSKVYEALGQPAECERIAREIEQLAPDRVVLRPPTRAPSSPTLDRAASEDATSTQPPSVIARIRRLVPTTVTVLIQGETGVGKSVLARIIHDKSPRAAAPFVTVNCAAIPEALLESELFGHARGAFTGAVGRGVGKFELAHRGTLFLDEVADLSPSSQSKILSALETRRFYPVGGRREVQVDVRILAATNQDLGQLVGLGRFREDLYYRLAGAVVHVPPLHARRDEIPALARRMLREVAEGSGRLALGLSPMGIDFLCTQRWPGNLRELKHALESAAAQCDGDVIDVELLRQTLHRNLRPTREIPADPTRPSHAPSPRLAVVPLPSPAIDLPADTRALLNERQRLGLARLGERPSFQQHDWRAAVGTTGRTATRDLLALVKLGLLERAGAGAGRRYWLRGSTAPR